MKASLISTLIVVPMLSLSSMAFASEPVAASEPMLLSAAEMDGVTAGSYVSQRAFVFQFNASPVTVTQVSVLNIGAFNGNNYAEVNSGNSSTIRQRAY